MGGVEVRGGGEEGGGGWVGWVGVFGGVRVERHDCQQDGTLLSVVLAMFSGWVRESVE